MRPFCIATIGAILGILLGLYFNNIALLIVLVIILITIFFICTKNQPHFCKVAKKYYKQILIFLVCLLFFYFYINLQETKFENIYKTYNKQEVKITAIVMSDKTEKEYKDVYEIQVKSIKFKQNKLANEQKSKNLQSFNMILNVKKKQNTNIKYGDKIVFTSIYEAPSVARNEGGFDYSKYLKTKNIAGICTVKDNEVKIIENNQAPLILKVFHNIKQNVIEKIKQILPNDTATLCISLLLGEKTELSEDIKENFQKSNLSHILAISGAHVSYILLGITSITSILKLHKRWSRIFIIFFLICFIILIGFTPSVTRACIMAILVLVSKICFRKSDIYQNLAFSSLVILILNPYSLLDIGFQLSFGGTIGIVLFSKRLFLTNPKENNQENNKENSFKNKTIAKLFKTFKDMCTVTLSANLLILPLMMYHFNTISITFIISNLLASSVLGIGLILGMIFIICIPIKPACILISYLLNPILKLLIIIADFCSKHPFSQILVPTPKIWQIIIYYILLFFIINQGIAKLKRILNIKTIFVVLCLIIILPYIFSLFPRNYLTINFIDVGQGDSMLITSPSNKTILIDGGGSETGSFDVGEKTLIPYLLDKGIMKIDYLIFSHFDTDHCRRLINSNGKIKGQKCNY